MFHATFAESDRTTEPDGADDSDDESAPAIVVSETADGAPWLAVDAWVRQATPDDTDGVVFAATGEHWLVLPQDDGRPVLDDISGLRTVLDARDKQFGGPVRLVVVSPRAKWAALRGLGAELARGLANNGAARRVLVSADQPAAGQPLRLELVGESVRAPREEEGLDPLQGVVELPHSLPAFEVRSARGSQPERVWISGHGDRLYTPQVVVPAGYTVHFYVQDERAMRSMHGRAAVNVGTIVPTQSFVGGGMMPNYLIAKMSDDQVAADLASVSSRTRGRLVFVGHSGLPDMLMLCDQPGECSTDNHRCKGLFGRLQRRGKEALDFAGTDLNLLISRGRKADDWRLGDETALNPDDNENQRTGSYFDELARRSGTRTELESDHTGLLGYSQSLRALCTTLESGEDRWFESNRIPLVTTAVPHGFDLTRDSSFWAGKLRSWAGHSAQERTGALLEAYEETVALTGMAERLAQGDAPAMIRWRRRLFQWLVEKFVMDVPAPGSTGSIPMRWRGTFSVPASVGEQVGKLSGALASPEAELIDVRWQELRQSILDEMRTTVYPAFVAAVNRAVEETGLEIRVVRSGDQQLRTVLLKFPVGESPVIRGRFGSMGSATFVANALAEVPDIEARQAPVVVHAPGVVRAGLHEWARDLARTSKVEVYVAQPGGQTRLDDLNDVIVEGVAVFVGYGPTGAQVQTWWTDESGRLVSASTNASSSGSAPESQPSSEVSTQDEDGSRVWLEFPNGQWGALVPSDGWRHVIDQIFVHDGEGLILAPGREALWVMRARGTTEGRPRAQDDWRLGWSGGGRSADTADRDFVMQRDGERVQLGWLQASPELGEVEEPDREVDPEEWLHLRVRQWDPEAVVDRRLMRAALAKLRDADDQAAEQVALDLIAALKSALRGPAGSPSAQSSVPVPAGEIAGVYLPAVGDRQGPVFE